MIHLGTINDKKRELIELCVSVITGLILCYIFGHYVLAAGFACFGRQLKGARKTPPKSLYHPDPIMLSISLLCSCSFWIEGLLSPGRGSGTLFKINILNHNIFSWILAYCWLLSWGLGIAKEYCEFTREAPMQGEMI